MPLTGICENCRKISHYIQICTSCGAKVCTECMRLETHKCMNCENKNNEE